MSATIATPEAVEEACNTHWQMHGTDPGYEEVIALVGGGSNKTISAPLKAWLAQPRPARRPLPKALADYTLVFQHKVWSLALEAAESALQHREHEASERITRANAVRDMAIQENESMRALAEEQAAKIERLQEQLAVLKVRLDGAPDLQSLVQQAERDKQFLREELHAALLRATHAEGLIEGLKQRNAPRKTRAVSRQKLVPNGATPNARASMASNQAK